MTTSTDAARHVLSRTFDEKGADAVEALAARIDDTVSDAAPLLAARGDADRARFALLLALGPPGSELRAAIDEVLATHRGPPRMELGPFLRTLAFALWRAEVAAQVEALRTKPPAVTVQNQRALVSTFLAPGKLTPDLDASGRLALRDSAGNVLVRTPALPVEVAALLAHRHMALVSMNGQRVLRAFATLGHRQKILREPDPRVLRFTGGLEGCAREVGLKDRANPGDAAQDLRLILEAGQQFHGWFPTREVGGLWTYVHEHSSGGRRGDPGRPAMLKVILSTALLPDAVYGLDGNRWLQPVTPMPPPFGDYAAEWARQAAFETELIGLLVKHRIELVDDGGAKLRDHELREAAERVGLAVRRVGPLLDFWARASQFLDRVAGGRWHLADNDTYRAARAFLDAAGHLSKQRATARARRGRKKR